MVKDGIYYGYIYKIYNDCNDKLYIGQTTTTIDHRWGQHISDSKYGESIIYRAMRKYGIENFHIEAIEELSANTKSELVNMLNDAEEYYIDKFKCLMHEFGYNMTKGGNNHSFYHKKPVIAYDRKGNVLFRCDSINDMYTLTGYDRSNIKKCCEGMSIPFSIDMIFRYAEDPFDKYNTDRKRSNSIPVYQFNLNGELINRFESIAEAARSVNGMRNGIRNNINNKTESYKGYVWNTESTFKMNSIKRFVPEPHAISVDLYSMDGKLLGEFKSITDGLKFIEHDNGTSSVKKCCDGKSPYAFGYVWRYHGDTFDKFSNINTRKVPIDMYSLDGVFEMSFDGIVDAAKYINLKSSESNIQKNCRGKCNSVGMHVFRYKGEPFDKYPVKQNTYKNINK